MNIERKVYFGLGDSIEIGDNSGIGTNGIVQNAVIGDDVIIGPDLLYIPRTHLFERTDISIRKQGKTADMALVIEDDVWIGARVTILPGIRIGKGSIVGAGSVVTKDVPQYSVVAGNPAKVVRLRT